MIVCCVHGSPLEARYCGPYTVLEKSNGVNYIISTPGRRKSSHINMLKRYYCQSDSEEKPTALTTVIQQEQVVEPNTNGEYKCMMRLSNSEILINLDEKLKHPRRHRYGNFPRCPRSNHSSCT